MAIHYQIDKNLRAVFTAIQGVLEDEEPVRYLDALLRDPDYEVGLAVLVDASRLERLDLTTSGVRKLAEYTLGAEARLQGAKVAIVAPTDVTFGVSRMYQTLRSEAPYEISVFRTREEALAWLGLPEGTGPPSPLAGASAI